MYHKLIILFAAFWCTLLLQAQEPTKNVQSNNEVEETEMPIMTQLGSTQYKGKPFRTSLCLHCPNMHHSHLVAIRNANNITAWFKTLRRCYHGLNLPNLPLSKPWRYSTNSPTNALAMNILSRWNIALNNNTDLL